jgi:hypothetical protein
VVKPIKVKRPKTETELEVEAVDTVTKPIAEVVEPGDGGFLSEMMHDPTVVETLTEDPLFKFIKKNGNALSTLAMVGLIAWVGYRAYQSSYTAAMENSAEVYAGVRSGLDSLKGTEIQLAEKVKQREELASKLESAKTEPTEDAKTLQKKT